MSITSLSVTFVNTYAPQTARPAAPAAAAERTLPAAPAESRSCDEHRPASRQNRLVEAMMSALRELGFGSPAATPAAQATSATAGTPAAQSAAAESVTTDEVAAAATVAAAVNTDAEAAAAAQAAAEPAVTVESAVREFAHELFRALRQGGRSEGSDGGSRRVDGEGGRRHHHGHHGWRNQGYGDMSQRLDALSQTFAAQLPAAAANDVQPPATMSSSISITLTVQDGQADAPVQALTTAAPATVATVAAETAEPVAADEPAVATAAAESSAKNPLLEAFSKLFNALKPQATAPSVTDMSDKLRMFLQTLAQAMRPETMSSIQTPQVGGLVNVTA